MFELSKFKTYISAQQNKKQLKHCIPGRVIERIAVENKKGVS